MRITNSMMVDNFLKNLNKNEKTLRKYSDQMSSGKNITRISDDPVSVLKTLRVRGQLSRINQYQDNVTEARGWVEQTESTLMEISSRMSDILDDVGNAATDTVNEDDKLSIAESLKGLRDGVMDSLNTSIGGRYLFAGYNTSNQPFTKDTDGTVLYNGIDLSDTVTNAATIVDETADTVKMEVGYSMQMEVGMNGIQVVGTGSTNFFNVMNNLISDLENGADADTITGYLTKIQDVQTELGKNLVLTGVQTQKLDTLENRYSQDEITYTEVKSNIEDVDTAEAYMNYQMASSVYQQALYAGSQVIQPTLMDFLS